MATHREGFGRRLLGMLLAAGVLLVVASAQARAATDIVASASNSASSFTSLPY